MAAKNFTRFCIFAVLLSVSAFSQAAPTATLQCAATVSGDDGISNSLTLMSSPQSAFGCCFLFNPVAGVAPNSYITASCDSNVIVLAHPIYITSIALEARKGEGNFNPFITLVITTPNNQRREFKMLWLAAGDLTRSYQWTLNMNLPAGSTLYLDSYFSANSSSICATLNACIASTVYTLQGPIN
jgi:hypothetical protein